MTMVSHQPSSHLPGISKAVIPLLHLSNISADPYDPLRPNNTPPAITQPSQRTPLLAGTRFEIHKGANYNDKNNTTLVVEGIPHGISLLKNLIN
jgi:hypothetical protein